MTITDADGEPVRERAHVAECPDCGQRFLGATPDDVRAHCEEEHGPLGGLYVFREKWP